MLKNVGEYPDDWGEIAKILKDAQGWRCERCGHEHDFESGHVLTVHHLIPNKALCEEWNLAVLCQRCHLFVQATVNMYVEGLQELLFFSPLWLQPHLEGFRKWFRSTRGGLHG